MSFLGRIILVALLTAPTLALAGIEDAWRRNDPPAVDAFGPLFLHLESGAYVHPARLVAEAPGGSASMTIRQPVRTRDEDRINLTWLPVIGGVFEPTANAEFAGATPAGLVWRDGDALVVGAGEGQTAALSDGVRLVVIANRGVTYHIPAGFAQDATSSTGGPRELVGRAYRAGETLLLVVNPSIVSPDG